MPLAPPLAQDDYAAGMVRVAPHLVPKNGAWRLSNMLLDDDGSAYRRGGTTAESNAPLDDGLTWVWDGELAGGHRTLFASAASFAVLGPDGETPVDVGGGGLTEPGRPAVVDGVLYVGGYAYAGARGVVAPYATGTVGVAEGATTVTGTGTAWLAALEAGSLLVIDGRLLAVDTVTDDTHLELAVPWPGATAAGLAYSAAAVQAIPAAYHPNGIYAAVGTRLLSADGDRIYESVAGDPTTWIADEFHQLTAGEHVLAIEGLGDRAFVFTTGGVWALSNLSYDLTDPFGDAQQRLERYSGEPILWGASGLAFWQDGIVVPALDGVWLLSFSRPMELLTRSIAPLYAEGVRQGYRPGGAAVHRGHYFLPILSGSDVVRVLVCRVERPVQLYRLGVIYPWTEWPGEGGSNVRALAPRTSSGTPVLLGADAGATARVVRIPAFKADGPALDHDGSVVVGDVVTRDIPTGPRNENTVKKVRARYELINGTGAATLEAAYGTDARPRLAAWGDMEWGGDVWADVDDPGLTPLAGVGPESDGDTPYPWRVNKRTRYMRVRLRSSGPCTRFIVRAVELVVRPSGRM